MRILVVHNYYQQSGGEDAVARDEFNLLKDFGEDVHFYERSNAELNGVSYFKKLRLLSNMGWSRGSYQDMRRVLKKIRPEVVHFHNIFYILTPSVYQACKDEGIPVVQSLHNFRLLCSNALFYRDKKVCEDCLRKNLWEGVRHKCCRNSRLFTGFLVEAIDRHWKKKTWMNKVDMYIMAAEFTRQKYLQGGIPKEKITVKPHFLSKDPGRRNGHKDYAIYVGRLSQEKGVDVLIQSWKLLNNIPLKIIGDGYQRDQLTELAKNNSDIELLGHISQQECERYMREANLLIIPSLCYESFPRILVEAYAHGLPVIASRLGSLAELIIDGKTGLLFEPGDTEDLAEKVRYLIDNENEHLSMGNQARWEYEQKYTPKKNYDQLIAIYKQVIESAQNVYSLMGRASF